MRDWKSSEWARLSLSQFILLAQPVCLHNNVKDESGVLAFSIALNGINLWNFFYVRTLHKNASSQYCYHQGITLLLYLTLRRPTV